jgi:hypothetical protein
MSVMARYWWPIHRVSPACVGIISLSSSCFKALPRRSHTKPLGLNLKNKMNTAEMEDFTDPYEPESTCSVVIVETENEPLYEGDQSDCENVFGEFMEIEVEQS